MINELNILKYTYMTIYMGHHRSYIVRIFMRRIEGKARDAIS